MSSRGLSPVLVAHAPPGTNPGKRARFVERRRAMLAFGWIYYPEKDLFVEKVSLQQPKWSPTRQLRFLPFNRKVWGREVYETPERLWQLYLDGHPRAIFVVDAWIGHPHLEKPASEGGLYDVDAFAVHDQEPVRRSYVG